MIGSGGATSLMVLSRWNSSLHPGECLRERLWEVASGRGFHLLTRQVPKHRHERNRKVRRLLRSVRWRRETAWDRTTPPLFASASREVTA